MPFAMAILLSTLVLRAADDSTPKKPVTDEYSGVRVVDDYRWLGRLLVLYLARLHKLKSNSRADQQAGENQNDNRLPVDSFSPLAGHLASLKLW